MGRGIEGAAGGRTCRPYVPPSVASLPAAGQNRNNCFGKKLLVHHHLPPAGLSGNHYPEIAAGLARAGRYDLVCYGHTLRVDRVGATWLVNPAS
jgi:hypothetical protein